MTEPIPLPTLHEGSLDDARLDALFEDIAREARVLAVLVKGGAETLSEGGDVPLDAARAALRAGGARAVQVRYVHQGVTWTDTVLRAPGGYRIVRMANDPA